MLIAATTHIMVAHRAARARTVPGRERRVNALRDQATTAQSSRLRVTGTSRNCVVLVMTLAEASSAR